MKNAFHSILKALFVIKIFQFLSWIVGHVEKATWLDNVYFKIYDVTTWLTNYYNTHIGQYPRSKSNQTMKFSQLIEYEKINIFLHKSRRKWGKKTSSRSLFVLPKCSEVKASSLQLSVNTFQWRSTWHTIKAKCVKL